MIRHLSAVAGAALVLAAVSAPAAAQSVYSAERMLKSIDDTALIATLDDMKVAHDADEGDDGTPMITMAFANGFKAFSYQRACDPNCQGLVLIGVFSSPEKMSNDKLLTTVREFNDSYPAGKVYVAADGNVYTQSYVIFDGGITMGNLRAQLEVFADMGDAVSGAIYKED